MKRKLLNNIKFHHLTCSYPNPLILVLELTLILIVILIIPFSYVRHSSGIYLIIEIGVLLFAAMGWISPVTRWQKLIYTGIEFGLILLLALVGFIPLFQFLFIVLVIRNSFLFHGLQRYAFTLLSYALCIVCMSARRIFPFPITLIQLIGSCIIFGLVILFLQLLIDAVIKEHQSRKALADANVKLQEYNTKIEELAVVHERNRIARDIHDSLGHSLTTFNFHLEAAIRLMKTKPNESEALLLELKDLNRKALASVRQSVSTLRANPLEGKSLVEAIRSLINNYHKSTGILPKLDFLLSKTLSNTYNFTIYCIIQESLTNSCKYANATVVDIQVNESDKYIFIMISDNGIGFDLNQKTTGFGLRGMEERVQVLLGRITIITAPNEGCKVMVYLPL